MKIIDLLNKIANGEINEDTIIEFDNGYKDYCSVRVFFDRYIADEENLNCEVEIIEEDKKIEKILYNDLELDTFNTRCFKNNFLVVRDKINEIIDEINGSDKK